MAGNDNDESAGRALIVRGSTISEDARGLICLDDLWELSGERSTRKPVPWKNTPSARALANALHNKIRKSDVNAGPVIYSRRGRGQKGTFAHPILAAAYAGYLDHDLEIEMRAVWLRYRAGDATLADEILQRASDEANHWAGVRALARSGRNKFTDILKAHGVTGKEGYMACTEAVYQALLDGKSWEIRARMGLPARTNLRDNLNATALAGVMLAEALSGERIEEEQRQGNADCATATLRSARAVRAAVDEDRRNRRGQA
jgi:hypothetical protein